MSNCRFLECELLSRTKCIACRKGLKDEIPMRRSQPKPGMSKVSSHCCVGCSQLGTNWTQLNTVEVISFTRKLGLRDLNLICLLNSIVTIEINRSLLWFNSLEVGNGDMQYSPRTTRLSLDIVRRLLRLWVKDTAIVEYLIQFAQNEDHITNLYNKLRFYGIGPLIGLFVHLRATRVYHGTGSQYSKNKQDILNIVHILEEHLIKDGWSQECILLDKAIQKGGETLYCTTLASLLELRFEDSLLPTTNTLGVAQLERYFFPNRRVIKQILLRRNLPTILTKLVLCHELVHLNLWFRLPPRPCGRHPIEELLCHAIMIHYANWLVRSRRQSHLTVAEYSLLTRRINRCYKKSDQVKAGLLRHWVNVLTNQAPIDQLQKKKLKNALIWSRLASEYFRLIY